MDSSRLIQFVISPPNEIKIEQNTLAYEATVKVISNALYLYLFLCLAFQIAHHHFFGSIDSRERKKTVLIQRNAPS